MDGVPGMNRLRLQYKCRMLQRLMVRVVSLFLLVAGDLSKRDDLVYTWLINGTVVSRTRVPVIDKRFEKTGLYQVSVVAKNDGKCF